MEIRLGRNKGSRPNFVSIYEENRFRGMRTRFRVLFNGALDRSTSPVRFLRLVDLPLRGKMEGETYRKEPRKSDEGLGVHTLIPSWDLRCYAKSDPANALPPTTDRYNPEAFASSILMGLVIPLLSLPEFLDFFYQLEDAHRCHQNR